MLSWINKHTLAIRLVIFVKQIIQWNLVYNPGHYSHVNGWQWEDGTLYFQHVNRETKHVSDNRGVCVWKHVYIIIVHIHMHASSMWEFKNIPILLLKWNTWNYLFKLHAYMYMYMPMYMYMYMYMYIHVYVYVYMWE